MIPNEGKLALLTDLAKPTPGGAEAGPYQGAELKMFTNDLALTAEMVLADLTEATFDGYAAAALAEWGQAYISEVGTPVIKNGSKQFNHAGTGAAETMYGWYIESAGGVILEVKRFTNPVPLATADDSVVVVPDVEIA